MNTKSQNQKVVYFVSRQVIGKVSHSVDSSLDGAFDTLDDAIAQLLETHDRTLKQVDFNLKSVFLSTYNTVSKIETDVCLYYAEIIKSYIQL